MWNRAEFAALFQPPLIGMIHLQPLPGAPGYAGKLSVVIHGGLQAAASLAQGGARALMVENYHDKPFYPAGVPAATIAAMTRVVAEIRREHPDLLIGINVLRNDAAGALAIACVTGAHFIRVNVHTGTVLTDQGLLQGKAHLTLRRRKELGADVAILADVQVKHGRPLVARPLGEEARDLRLRGLADALIVTGPATGSAAHADDLRAVRDVLPDCPLLVGSGVDCDNVIAFAPWADGYIVGSSLQEKSNQGPAAISAERTAALLRAVLEASSHLRKGMS